MTYKLPLLCHTPTYPSCDHELTLDEMLGAVESDCADLYALAPDEGRAAAKIARPARCANTGGPLTNQRKDRFMADDELVQLFTDLKRALQTARNSYDEAMTFVREAKMAEEKARRIRVLEQIGDTINLLQACVYTTGKEIGSRCGGK